MLNNIKTMQKDRGFTIVELLIVIVVIGILAAITIVAYGNITTRANTNAAKANAANIAKVAEAYNADDQKTGYPSLANLQGYGSATTDMSKFPNGVTAKSTTLSGTATEKSGKEIQYVPKGTTGGCIGYWDSTATPAAAVYILVGNAVTGTNAATPTCT